MGWTLRFCSARQAATKRQMALSLGKIPATVAGRQIAPFCCSIGGIARWSRGKDIEASPASSASSINLTSFGTLRRIWSATARRWRGLAATYGNVSHDLWQGFSQVNLRVHAAFGGQFQTCAASRPRLARQISPDADTVDGAWNLKWPIASHHRPLVSAATSPAQPDGPPRP